MSSRAWFVSFVATVWGMLGLVGLVVVVAFLAGCGASLQTLQREILSKGAAADDAHETAEFVMCRGLTVGDWERKYGNNPALAEAWRAFCRLSLTPAAAAPGVVSVPVTVPKMMLIPERPAP